MSDEEKKPARAETGNMRFGEDWNGTFIRGDNAMYYGIQLQCLLADFKLMMKQAGREIGPFDPYHTCEELCKLLQKSNHFAGNETQVMKNFKECFDKIENKK